MTSLLLIALAGVLCLVVLVVGLRLHAFVALMMVSGLVGLAAGMSGQEVLKAIQEGMGGTLGFIAVVVGLGAMFGQLLEESGGAQKLAETLVSKFGIKRAPWALVLTGFVVSIPVFFDVGFIILVPLVYGLARQTDRPVVAYALPLLAGLAVTHAFVPPTPGPVAVAELLKADMGRVIFLGIAAGLPAALVGGPVWASFISRKVTVRAPEHDVLIEDNQERPPFILILCLVAVPLILIVANTVSQRLSPQSTVASVFGFLGHPFVALTLATLGAFYFLGIRRGKSTEEVRAAATRGLEPTGMIILVTGAGGVFKQILGQTGIGKALASSVLGLGLSPVLFAFLVALLVRVAQGSSTVSMLTAAGFVEPVVAGMEHPDLALFTIAIAAGATACSHFNDSGFWLVKEYLGLSESETLKTWTVMTTIIGVVGLISAWCISSIFPVV